MTREHSFLLSHKPRVHTPAVPLSRRVFLHDERSFTFVCDSVVSYSRVLQWPGLQLLLS